MKLKELIESLQQLIDEEDATGEEEILFAHQPNYPLQCGVGGPVLLNQEVEDIRQLESFLQFPIGEYFEDQADWNAGKKRLEQLKRAPATVYLHETSLPYDTSPYAPREAWGE